MSEKKWITPLMKQVCTMSAVLLNMGVQGMLLAFPSCLLPDLRRPDSAIKTDLYTASWLSSCLGIALIPGSILSSCLMTRLGRKLTHQLVMIPGLIGWLLVSQASNVPMLMIGRILSGITAGATTTLDSIIVGEYTSPENRGMFLNLKTAAVCLGSMIIHIIGNFLHWRTIALWTLIPYTLTILIILTWPESPAWLASRKEFEKCKESFLWLRGRDESSVRELEEMIKAQMSVANKDTQLKDSVKQFFRKFTRKDFLKPVAIAFVGILLLEVCGRHIFPAYALDIIGEVSGDKSDSFYYTLGIDIIITASCTFSSVLVRIFRVRTLLFSTGFASVAVIGVLCGYLFLISRGVIPNAPGITIGLFLIYFILVNLGCTPIPISFMGELFPLAHRGVGSMIYSIILSLNMYAGLQITPYLLLSLKVYGTFTVFGVTTAICLVILYFTLPETKDRTLQEIEDYFNYGKFKDAVDGDDDDVKLKMLSGDAISNRRSVI